MEEISKLEAYAVSLIAELVAQGNTSKAECFLAVLRNPFAEAVAKYMITGSSKQANAIAVGDSYIQWAKQRLNYRSDD